MMKQDQTEHKSSNSWNIHLIIARDQWRCKDIASSLLSLLLVRCYFAGSSLELALALVAVSRRCCCFPRWLLMLIAWSSLAGVVEGEKEQRAFADWRDEREAAICLAILAGEKRREGARREDMRRGKQREEGDGRSERESSPAMVELSPVLTDGGGC
ncbi:hypothetical protein KY285_023942 [Solanum tuberosum]|nr:hypothetical protein KY289_024290 [Solanum tuberosum]KAH0676141.1 hypothetical protein KY285_023942 [Solanum tuberosum]